MTAKCDDISELAAKAQAGSGQAKDNLLRRLEPVFRSAVKNYWPEYRNLFDKDDLLQECRIAALSALEQWNRTAAFLTLAHEWIHRRLSRMCLTESEKAVRTADVDWSRVEDTVPSGSLDDAPFKVSLDGLSERQRRVIELRFGLSGEPEMGVNEIGQRLGVSGQAVSKLMNESLAKLRGLPCPPGDPAT